MKSTRRSILSLVGLISCWCSHAIAATKPSSEQPLMVFDDQPLYQLQLHHKLRFSGGIKYELTPPDTRLDQLTGINQFKIHTAAGASGFISDDDPQAWLAGNFSRHKSQRYFSQLAYTLVDFGYISLVPDTELYYNQLEDSHTLVQYRLFKTEDYGYGFGFTTQLQLLSTLFIEIQPQINNSFSDGGIQRQQLRTQLNYQPIPELQFIFDHQYQTHTLLQAKALRDGWDLPRSKTQHQQTMWLRGLLLF